MFSSPQNPLVAPQELQWLYIDFNSYFASIEQQMNPALRGKPIAVIPVESDYTSAIAASYEAKAFGVKTGTRIKDAKQMCPGLICVMAHHNYYVEFHERIIDEIDRHIPVTKVCSIDEMACRLMKNERSPEQIAKITRSIKDGIARNIGESVRCSIGAAPNKYLAKVATDMQKPDGFTILNAADLPHKLMGLKLRDLPGIGPNMEVRLNKAGIYDIQKLLTFQPKHLRAVWGSIWGEKMWYYLRGFDVPDEETERGSVGHSHVLAPEMRPPQHAYQIARRLMLKASARLRRMKLYAGALSLSVRVENGPRIGLETRCMPAQDSHTFLEMMEAMWEEILKETKNARFKKVSITLSHVTETANLQADLFDPVRAPEALQARAKNEKISAAIDKLNHKFGKDTVLLGMSPKQGKQIFTGTKIAFTRIPDMEEFLE